MSQTTVIIGAGHAGGEAAIQLRQAGYAGRIVLVGAEPHVPYERPPLSKELLAGDMAVERTYLRPPPFYGEHDIELMSGRTAAKIDRAGRKVVLADGGTLAYDTLILATGARLTRLDVPGADLGGVHYMRTIEDSLAIREALDPDTRLAVVGGGYIGLEVAAVARKLGARVTVIEMADRVMARVVSEPVSEFFAAYHRDQGVNFRLGEEVSEILGQEKAAAVRTASGMEIPADAVVIGIGIAPETALAEEAGLPVDDGIIVDDHCRTEDPAIYAIGDATRHPNAIYGTTLRLESVHNAMGQARVAARNIAGGDEVYREVPWFWSNQYDLRLQSAGVPARGDDIVVRGDAMNPGFSVAYLRDGRMTALEAVNAPRDFVAAKKLIAGGAVLDPDKVADPEIPLKTLG